MISLRYTPFLFVAMLLLHFTTAYTQILDTSSHHDYTPLEVSYTQSDDLLFFDSATQPLDTSLNLFYNYYPTYQTTFPLLDLGLEATPTLNLSGSNAQLLDLRLGADQMLPYFFDDSIHIYQTDKPFTRLNYSQGANEMLSIAVTHGQQISKRLSFGVDYRRIKNQNFYFSNLENFSRVRMGNLFNTKFYTNYYSSNRKYEMVASYVWNKSVNVESGGLKSDSIFNRLEGRDKLNNNLIRYTNALGTLAQNKFKITQYFRPGGLSNDSVRDVSLRQFKHQFFNTTSLCNERVEFLDNAPDSTNYGQNMAAFKDSSHHRSIENEFGHMIALDKLSIANSLAYDYSTVYQNSYKQTYHNLYFHSRGKLHFEEATIQSTFQLGLVGYNAGDYAINGTISKKFNHTQWVAGIVSQQTTPTVFQQTFRSNATQWESNFSKIQLNQVRGSLSRKIKNHKLRLTVLGETIRGFIYYHDTNQVSQHAPSINYMSIAANHHVRTTHFGSDIQWMIQQSSDPEILPRPTQSVSANLYSQFRLFQKNLRVQLGIRTYWFSSFNSPAYNPYTRAWHNTQRTFEANPPIQVYTNAKVKSFCFGVEFFHAQQGLMGADYYNSPGYPSMPRSLRLNIRWDLKN